jgi:hypothetical protein
VTGHDDIDFGLYVPVDMEASISRYVLEQDLRRGPWPSLRGVEQPQPPWPSEDNEMLRFLFWQYQARVDAGLPAENAMVVTAVHAWYEGGIEGYDRGRWAATPP